MNKQHDSLDNQALEQIRDIANEEVHRAFPLLGNHFSDSDVLYILKAYIKWYYLNKEAEDGLQKEAEDSSLNNDQS